MVRPCIKVDAKELLPNCTLAVLNLTCGQPRRAPERSLTRFQVRLDIRVTTQQNKKLYTATLAADEFSQVSCSFCYSYRSTISIQFWRPR